MITIDFRKDCIKLMFFIRQMQSFFFHNLLESSRVLWYNVYEYVFAHLGGKRLLRITMVFVPFFETCGDV